MRKDPRKSFVVLGLIAAVHLTSARAQEPNQSKAEQAAAPATTTAVVNSAPVAAPIPGRQGWT
jgi:hypothetical protein